MTATGTADPDLRDFLHNIGAKRHGYTLPEQIAELATLPRWIGWRYEPDKNGRRTKVPYQARDPKRRASSTDPSTWAPLAAVNGSFDGPGIMLGDGLQGVDLDACIRPDWSLEPWAAEIVDRFDTYTEVSPSGRGLKLLFRGPAGERSTEVTFGEPVDFGNGETKRREIAYYSGARYFTVTREVREPAELREVTAADIAWLRSRIEAKRVPIDLEALPAWLRTAIVDGAPDGQRSEKFFAVVSALADLKHSETAIVKTLRAFPDGIASKYAGRIEAEVRRVLGKGSGAPEPDEPKPERDKLTPVGFKAFTAGLEPPSYAVDGLLIRGYCYSFTGHSGHGKTAIALTLAVCIALGVRFADRETTPERVLYIAGENPDDVRMRARALAEAMDVEPDELDGRLMFLDQSFTLAERHAELIEVIEAGEFGLIVLDTDQALSSGADENDNRERIEHAKRVRLLTKARPRPTVVDLCHPPYNAARTNLRPRGGSSFLAEIDGNAGVWLDDGDSRAELFRTTKFRGPMFEPIGFEIKVVELPDLQDSKGRAMTTVIALPAVEDDFEADEERRKRRLAVLADVSLYPGDSIRVRVQRTGVKRGTLANDLDWLKNKGAITEAMDGHEISRKGKSWLAAA